MVMVGGLVGAVVDCVVEAVGGVEEAEFCVTDSGGFDPAAGSVEPWNGIGCGGASGGPKKGDPDRSQGPPR